MPDRDLDITKFSFPSYRKLKKALGEFDAVVECNEIAIREFIEKAQKGNPKRYIQELSHKHKLRVDEVDFVKFSSRIRQYYVSSVFQQSEQFFKDFKIEWKKYFNGKNWIEPKDGETKFQNTVKNTGVSLPSDLVDIYEYYRIIRNYMSHTDRDLHDLRNRHKKIHANKNTFLHDFHLSFLPNEIDDVDFTDFLILTNIVKHVAYVLSTSSKPDNERISELLFGISKESNRQAFKGIKKLKNDNKRFESAIISFTSSNFGRFSTSDQKEIKEKMKSLLA